MTRWRDEAAQVLEEELRRNTFPSGVNREMAFDYHGFVVELAVVAAVEAEWAGRPLSDELWALLARMFDVVAATVDVKLRAPRYGDGDDGRALVLDGPTAERWPGLLAVGAVPVRDAALVADRRTDGGELARGDRWPADAPPSTRTAVRATMRMRA